MNYKPIVSSNIESFLESQLFRDYSFVVSLLLANGNFTLANLMAKKIQDIAISLKDTRINCLITEIIPTNSTFVGRVSGNASLTGVSLTGVWDLLTMVRLVNFTDLVNNYTEFENLITPFITNRPSNFTVLTPPSSLSLSYLENPFQYLPAILTNNWTYWDSSADVSFLIDILNWYIPLIPAIWNLSLLLKTYTYRQNYLGVPAWGINLFINVSYMVDQLFNLLHLYWTDFFNASFNIESNADWGNYVAWLNGMDSGCNISAIFHRDSGVLLEFRLWFDSTQFWNSIETILTNLNANLIHNSILDIIVNAIHNFPELGEMYFGVQLSEFVYNGQMVISEVPANLTWLYVTLAIGIPVGVAIVIVLWMRMGQGFAKIKKKGFSASLSSS